MCEIEDSEAWNDLQKNGSLIQLQSIINHLILSILLRVLTTLNNKLLISFKLSHFEL